MNYTEEAEALKRGFKIYPNGQLSKLGNGVTELKSHGEIHETFFRNSCKIKWRSLVSKQLTAPYIGGTVFMKDNQIEQDLVRDVIHVLDRKITVKPTDPINLLPTEPTFKAYNTDPVEEDSKVQVKTPAKCNLVNNNTIKVLFPGQHLSQPANFPEGSIVAVEPWEQNKNPNWPEPQLCTVSQGKIKVENSTINPIVVGKEVKLIRIRSTEDYQEPDPYDDFYKFTQL